APGTQVSHGSASRPGSRSRPRWHAGRPTPSATWPSSSARPPPAPSAASVGYSRWRFSRCSGGPAARRSVEDRMASLSRQLAQWVVGLRYEDLPAAVVDRAKSVTLQGLASVLLGSQSRDGQQAVKMVVDEEAGVARGVTIMVDGTKVTSGGAPLPPPGIAVGGREAGNVPRPPPLGPTIPPPPLGPAPT